MQNISLLTDYIQNFYGYGHSDAAYWFIGLEEGDLTQAKELDIRLANWEKESDPHFMDVVESHRNLAGSVFYCKKGNIPVKNQATITRVVKLYMIANGMYNMKEAMAYNDKFHSDALNIQGGGFARKDKSFDTMIMELYPLPCHKTSTWDYAAKFPEIHWLSSKSSYKNHIENTRISDIFDLLKTRKPKAVVLYFLNAKTEKFINDNCIAHFGSPLKKKQIGKEMILYNVYNGTAFYFIKHVNAAAGMSNDDLYAIAEDIAKVSHN
ncbi:MAG: hypothetical protein ACM3PT_10280 [Deltaproteobacteria bacterium]